MANEQQALPLPVGTCSALTGSQTFSANIRIIYVFDVVKTTTTTIEQCEGAARVIQNNRVFVESGKTFTFTCRFKKNPFNPMSNDYIFMNEEEYRTKWENFQLAMSNMQAEKNEPIRTIGLRTKTVTCRPARCENGVRQPAEDRRLSTIVTEKTQATPRIAQAVVTSSLARCSFT